MDFKKGPIASRSHENRGIIPNPVEFSGWDNINPAYYLERKVKDAVNEAQNHLAKNSQEWNNATPEERKNAMKQTVEAMGALFGIFLQADEEIQQNPGALLDLEQTTILFNALDINPRTVNYNNGTHEEIERQQEAKNLYSSPTSQLIRATFATLFPDESTSPAIVQGSNNSAQINTEIMKFIKIRYDILNAEQDESTHANLVRNSILLSSYIAAVIARSYIQNSVEFYKQQENSILPEQWQAFAWFFIFATQSPMYPKNPFNGYLTENELLDPMSNVYYHPILSTAFIKLGSSYSKYYLLTRQEINVAQTLEFPYVKLINSVAIEDILHKVAPNPSIDIISKMAQSVTKLQSLDHPFKEQNEEQQRNWITAEIIQPVYEILQRLSALKTAQVIVLGNLLLDAGIQPEYTDFIVINKAIEHGENRTRAEILLLECLSSQFKVTAQEIALLIEKFIRKSAAKELEHLGFDVHKWKPDVDSDQTPTEVLQRNINELLAELKHT